MPDKYDKLESCEKVHEDYFKFKEFVNVKGFPSKVSWKIYMWITGFIILALVGSFGYTNETSKDHENLAKQREVHSNSRRVRELEKTQVKITTTLDIMNNNQQKILNKLEEIDKKVEN